MKNIVNYILFILTFSFIIVSCDPENVIDTPDKGKAETAADYIWDDSNVKTISFSNTSISASSPDVIISGTTATITKAGYYSVSGNLTDGQLIVNAPKAKMKIMLSGVTMSNSTTAPVYIQSASKVIVFLKTGTTNTFSDASIYTNTGEPKATFFSNAYLAFTGDGTLTIQGNYNDGISCDDEIIINNGKINVSALDDAIRAKDYLLIHDGNINCTGITGHALKADSTDVPGRGYVKIDGGDFSLSSAQGDGIHAYKRIIIEDGTFDITSDDSQALRSDSSVLISGGTINVANSKQGIESPYITIAGGTTNISTSKIAVNATFGNSTAAADSSLLTVSGGNLNVNSLSYAFSSDGNINISGGTTVLQGALSTSKPVVRYAGEFTISNGLFIGCGPNAGSSIKGFSAASTQNSVKIASSSIATSLINIQNAGGNSLATFKPIRTSYYILFSSPALQTAGSYSIFSGGSYTSGTSQNGYYTNGTYSGGTKKTTFTVSSNITEVSF